MKASMPPSTHRKVPDPANQATFLDFAQHFKHPIFFNCAKKTSSNRLSGFWNLSFLSEQKSTKTHHLFSFNLTEGKLAGFTRKQITRSSWAKFTAVHIAVRVPSNHSCSMFRRHVSLDHAFEPFRGYRRFPPHDLSISCPAHDTTHPRGDENPIIPNSERHVLD